jgi:hypothetical protein
MCDNFTIREFNEIEKLKVPGTFGIISVPGDGDCFFHSLLYSFSSTYSDATITEKRDIVKKLRSYLADKLTEESYEKIDENTRVTLKNEGGIKYLKNMLLKETIEISVIGFISDIVRLNIFIIHYDKFIFVTLAGGRYNSDYQSVIIYHTHNHFESVVKILDDKIQSVFDDNDEVVSKLRTIAY